MICIHEAARIFIHEAHVILARQRIRYFAYVNSSGILLGHHLSLAKMLRRC